jgi:hypothetical protein
MRKVTFGIAVSAILLSAEFAVAEPPTPNFTAAAASATDIVVTDIEGRVLETWRGSLQPGNMVKLGLLRQSPVDVLPMEHVRLRPEFAISGLYRRVAAENDEAEKQLRLVLFLRKEATPGGLQPYWWPALSREFFIGVPIEFGYRFHEQLRDNSSCDFGSSAAWVEGGRVLALQLPAGPTRGPSFRNTLDDLTYPTKLVPVADSLKEFKDKVMWLSAPPKTRPGEKAQSEPSGSLRSWADFGNFISYPPQPSAKGTTP